MCPSLCSCFTISLFCAGRTPACTSSISELAATASAVGAAVAGEHHDADSFAVQPFDCFRRGGLHRIGHGDQSGEVFRPAATKHDGLAVGFERLGAFVRVHRAGSPARRRARDCRARLLAVDVAVTPLPVRERKSATSAGAMLRSLAARENCGGQRMFARAFERGREAQHFCLRRIAGARRWTLTRGGLP